MTFIQRFGGPINLHIPFHALVLDGVYADPDDTGIPRFFTLSSPSEPERPSYSRAYYRQPDPLQHWGRLALIWLSWNRVRCINAAR